MHDMGVSHARMFSQTVTRAVTRNTFSWDLPRDWQLHKRRLLIKPNTTGDCKGVGHDVSRRYCESRRLLLLLLLLLLKKVRCK